MTENLNTINMTTDFDDDDKDIKTITFDSSAYRYITVCSIFLIIIVLLILANYL
jgi:hypothetical protein